MAQLTTSEIPIFLLVSVAEQVGLNITQTETPMISFLATRPSYDDGISRLSYLNIAMEVRCPFPYTLEIFVVCFISLTKTSMIGE